MDSSVAAVLAALVYTVSAFPLVLLAVAALLSLEYLPGRMGLWLGCVAALLAAALWLEVRRGTRHRRWLPLPPLLIAAVLRLYIGTGGLELGQSAMALLDLALGGALFARAQAGKGLKWGIGMAALLVLQPTLLMMGASALFGTDGLTLRYYPSPDGAYEAEVRVSDEGALGGSVTVTIFRDPLSLPFGTLRRVEGAYRREWVDPDALEVVWTDTDTVAVNGEVWRWRE